MNAAPRIVCVSNRLPVTATEENGKLEFLPSSGGLVTALQPVLEMWQGVWAGWPGTLTSAKEAVEGALAEFSAQSDFQLLPVLLDQEAVTGFYQGFSNQIIWPLFHDLQSRCNFEPEFWEAYIRVQHSFRDELLKHIRETDLLWVHDYHLIGLGNVLRKEGFQGRIAFFLHTPFPGPDIFSKLPWRNEVLESLLSYDLVGFQTQHEVHNFLDCVEALTPYRYTRRRELFAVKVDKLECAVGGFPVSIDFNEFEGSARLPEVEAKAKTIRDDMNVEFLVLSMDRLDYTKGIPYRIKAFKRMLELEPNLKKRVALLQVVVPSRVEVPEYKQLRLEIEQLVSELNGTHGEPGWVPVHHLFRSLLREEVIAMYRASDVALVTPLKDGMNLVAKEYCATRINNGGALILSEFAGAADEFRGDSILVNPYDIDGVARALIQAFSMSKDDLRGRMANLRAKVREADVMMWARNFLSAAGWQWKASHAAPRPANVWDKLRRLTKVFDS